MMSFESYILAHVLTYLSLLLSSNANNFLRLWLKSFTSENYTCMHMTLNIKRHINFLIRHIIY